MGNREGFFEEALRKESTLNTGLISKIIQRVSGILEYQPVVGVFGKTGAGKSSLCNAVFGQDVCKISDISGCTRQPQEVILGLEGKGIKLLDVPGVGENQQRDKEYTDLYRTLLPELDLMLWVIKGDDRAFSSDELFYKNLVKPYLDKGLPFVIVLNQVDKIEPFREWDGSVNQPGAKQAANIEEKRKHVADIFGLPLSCVIPVSANERYGLVSLVDRIIEMLPKAKKAVLLDAVRDDARSSHAKTEAKNGFLDQCTEILTSIIPIAPLAKAAVKIISNVLSKIFSWW